MLDEKKIKEFYNREDIQEAILANSGNREVAVKFKEGFGKRPDMLQYKQDIVELANQGATSFHASEELWENPLMLDPMMKKTELKKLRIGWDLIIDIDCDFLEISKIATNLVIKAIKYHNIESISCKYSGNKGFHLGLPFEIFPDRVFEEETKDLFPDGPRKIAFYLQDMIKEKLSKEILDKISIEAIRKRTGKDAKELIKNKKLNPFSIVDIDTLLISSRHLYRMPYCFNEKSGLVSVPIDPEKVLEFNKEDAKAENVKISKFKFLDKKNLKGNEGKSLIVQAFDFNIKKEEVIKKRKYEEITTKISEDFFPPCIQSVLKGLEDGRKRALFILINFLKNVGWEHTDIEAFVNEWNKKNHEPLRENYVVSQLNYHKGRKKILPPNCHNNMYYMDMGIKCDENICSRFKNPVNYSVRRTKYMRKGK